MKKRTAGPCSDDTPVSGLAIELTTIPPDARDIDALIAAADSALVRWEAWCEETLNRVGGTPEGTPEADVSEETTRLRRHAAHYVNELHRWGHYLWIRAGFARIVTVKDAGQLTRWCKFQMRLVSFPQIWLWMDWRLVREAVREGIQVVEQLGSDPSKWPPLPTWPEDNNFRPWRAPRRGVAEEHIVRTAWSHLRKIAEPGGSALPPEPAAPDEPAKARAALDTVVSWCSQKHKDATPVWDGYTLTFEGVECCKFKRSDGGQTAILDAFQKLQWNNRIDQPFGDDWDLKKHLWDRLQVKVKGSPLQFFGGKSGLCWKKVAKGS